MLSASFKKHLYLVSIAIAMLFAVSAHAQFGNFSQLQGSQFNRSNNNGRGNRNSYIASDSIDSRSIPKGLKVWTIDERFGDIRPTQPDTLTYLFQNTNYTGGLFGQYNHTGNISAPRVARIYTGRQDYMMGNQFIFARPYDWFLRPISQFLFTNTKSPLAMLNYHSSGSKVDGDDHFQAFFSTNINKRAGIGFTIDYAYGQGYYAQQSNSSFGGNLYGSYRDEQYQLHAIAYSNFIKNIENGGLQDEAYLTNPESFPTRYRSNDMPVRLEGVKNQVGHTGLYFTHKYAVGFYQYADSTGKVVRRISKAQMALLSTALKAKPIRNDSLKASKDSLTVPQNQAFAQQQKAAMDSLTATSMASLQQLAKDSTLHREFIPVAALIHTFHLNSNSRRFSSQKRQTDFFQNFFLPNDVLADSTTYLSVQNTVALELQEGFRKWVKMGMRLFAKHEFLRIGMPSLKNVEELTTLHYFTVGAQLLSQRGSTLRYRALGEMRTTGKDWGEFNLEGEVGLHFKLSNDTLRFTAGGFVRNESPAYYYEHFHGSNAWWDNNLNKIFRVRLEGALAYGNTRLSVGLESVQNHVYLQESQQAAATPSLSTMKYGVDVAQASQNIQIASANLENRLRWGVLHWENQFTLQKSSADSYLPLPLFTGWSNVYLQFKIARVLHTQLGASVSYFTPYYAPAYSPAVGLYAVQDAEQRTKLGNYPWVNAYINFMLKGVRFYLAYEHVNADHGRYFLTPHYPTNPRVLRFGVSWRFFN